MKRYSLELINEVLLLRSQGKTYREINQFLNLNITKSTLSDWCRNVNLPKSYPEKIKRLNLINLKRARKISLKVKKLNREEYFHEF